MSRPRLTGKVFEGLLELAGECVALDDYAVMLRLPRVKRERLQVAAFWLARMSKYREERVGMRRAKREREQR